MTYADALAVLHALPRFADAGAAAYRPGLERMHALMDATGRPHERFASVHVGGTNGKGSTASMTAAMATAAGLRTGLHTSPHLFDFAERLRLAPGSSPGQALAPAPHAWIAGAVARYRADFARIQPSFFEASVALSFRYFADEAVDLAVVEVGLGGRLDATNVLRPLACGITSIGLDHTDLLGDTLAAVAREKAGIAKPGVPLLTSAAQPEALGAIRETAEAAGAPVEVVRETVRVEEKPGGLTVRTPVRTYRNLTLGLAGAHQVANATLAVRLAEVAVPGLSVEAVRTGLAEVQRLSGLRGRCEVWSERPRIVADVAHNADGWRAALACARPGGDGRLAVLVGVMADKDAGALARLLAEAGATALPVDLPSARALARRDLAEQLRAHGVPVVAVADVAAGLAWFRAHAGPADVLLATGSHQTVEALGAAAPAGEAG